MDKKTAYHIIFQSLKSIEQIFSNTAYSAECFVMPLTFICKRRQVVARIYFMDQYTDKELFSYEVLLVTSFYQIKVKTLTLSTHTVPDAKWTLLEMCDNPEFSNLFSPYRKVNTLGEITVNAFIADFLINIDNFFKVKGFPATYPKTYVKYYEVLTRQYIDTAYSKFVSKN